ncbi:MAG: BsuBI/PstI family type II restriction endonuclease, partial [Candidatus Neomarinimicrobiota bacterium]
ASMRSYLADIAWESEVWVSSDPSHLIHFNGDKFMGPFEK